jgi:hypothetical protein
MTVRSELFLLDVCLALSCLLLTVASSTCQRRLAIDTTALILY